MRALRAIGLLVVLAAASAGCGVLGNAGTKPPPPNISGEIAALRGAPAGAYGSVEAIRLADGTIVAAAATKDARYELKVPPGSYVLASRTAVRDAGETLLAPVTIDVGAQPRVVNIPMMIEPFGRIEPARRNTQTAGGTIGIVPMPVTGPLGLVPGMDASGALIVGFLDPCQKRGSTLVSRDPRVMEFIRQEQQLYDDGRTDRSRPRPNPLNPDTMIEGSVTVAADATPTVEITIRDTATGEVLTRILEQGQRADGYDLGPLLRDIGRRLAAELCPRPTPTPTASRSTATLTVRVSGESSVEYTAVSTKYYCGGGSRRGQPQQCELEVPRGSEVDFQRTLSLTTEEEARWRLTSWGGCAGTNVDGEPRGGHCKVTMDRDRTIQVNFERRVMLRVTHQLVGDKALGFQWSLFADPQKGSGNPLASMGGAQQNCNLPPKPVALSGPANDYKVTDPCDFYAMYDAGTTLTIDIGARGAVEVSTFQGWAGGPCTGRVFSCQFKIQSDTTVTTSFQQR